MSEQYRLVFAGLKASAFRSCKNPDLLKLKNNTEHEPKILSLDTEDNQKGKTFMTNIFDGENHFTFRSTETAIEYLIYLSKKYKKGVEVWTANLQYDTGNVFREAQDELNITLAGSRFITTKIYKEKVRFKDIFNVIPGASVKKLGKLIDLEKLDSGNDFDNEEYCQRDTEIVYWSLLNFKKALRKMNVELKTTAAGTAFNALLQKYPVLTVNNFTEQDHEFLKKGFYGGRTEVFNTAEHTNNIHGYDLISCYPDAMRKIPILDTSTKKYTKKPNLKNEGMIDCLIEAPKNISVPYLPIKHDDKLLFPRGEFRGVWTYFEIREAKKLGYKINKIFSAIEFSAVFDFKLNAFVNKIFEERAKAKKSGDLIMDYVCKILLNSAYGRFAMGNEKTELVAFEQFFKIKGDFCSEIYPNNQISIKRITDHAPSTNFMTAALITAYGRHELYKHLINAENTGVLLYCDTDSVFFKGPKFKGLPKNPTLGDLDYQYAIKKARFVLPKTYHLEFQDGGEIFKCKGVWGELARNYFTKGYVEKMQPLKYIETLRKNFQIQHRNNKFNTSEKYLPFNLWVNKTKSKASDYTKRIAYKNGTTQPFKMNYCVETSENSI